MSAALKWREQFGYEPWSGNLDAFNDALRGEPFDTADDSAICIENFQALAADDEAFARGLLDIMSTNRVIISCSASGSLRSFTRKTKVSAAKGSTGGLR